MFASTITSDQALQTLLDGNRRYVSGGAQHPRQNAERRSEVAGGQHPIVALLSCADSRVAPEVFFDQGVGDLFICRNAGNITDDVVLGSIEYGVEHLGIPLIMVLGHTKCGAVTAAVGGGEVPGYIGSIVKTIAPAVQASKNQPGDAVMNAVETNVRMMVEQLKNCDPIISEKVRHGGVQVVGGVYHIDSGVVEML